MQNSEDAIQSNIIQETRDIIQTMNQQQRFEKAKRHLMDALNYRIPRSDFETNEGWLFRRTYLIQTSYYWSSLLFLLSFIFMYLVAGEPTNRMHKNSPLNVNIVAIEVSILTLYWLDIAMEVYHKQSWNVHWRQKFSQLFFVKLSLITLLTTDSIVYYSLYADYPIRLFRILRPFLPYLYNHFARKAFQSFIGVYPDIVAYLVFYFSIIFSFGILSTQLIELPPGTQFDWYKNNYNDVGQASFLLYILASFDSWPDYWIPAMDSSRWYNLFYVTFIFLNFFYFVTIPTTVMFNSFKRTRSILMIIDEINQQNSLLLCFLCLGENNLCIESEIFHQFMLYAYRNKVRLIDQIKELSFRLDENQDSDLFVSEFLNLCKVIEKEPDMYPPEFDDWQPYIRFRNFLKRKLYIKKVVNSVAFYGVVIALAMASLIVIAVSPFRPDWNNLTVEVVFVILFEIEILVKILGHGIERFMAQTGNLLELVLGIISLILLMLSQVISHSTLIELLGLVRIFRLPLILNTALMSDYLKGFYYRSVFLRKLRILFQDLYVSVIIGMRMFPLFMTLYYILGIIGIEAYDESFLTQTTSPYSFYDKVANFRSFFLSQIVIVQSMVEAGWSMIIFDHSYRFGNTILVYLYFIMIHVLIDTTIFSLMKGMVADLYEAITLDFEAIDKEEEKLMEDELFAKQRRAEITEIKQNVELGLSISYDSLKKKEIYETKLDKLMLQNLKHEYEKKHNKKRKNKEKVIRSLALTKSLETLRMPVDEIKSYPVFETPKSIDPLNSSKDNIPKTQDEDFEDDFESFDSEDSTTAQESRFSEIDDYIMDRIILRMDEVAYKEKPEYPDFLLDFLSRKLTIAKERPQKGDGPFNPNFMSIKGQASISFYSNVLESLLEIRMPENERKDEIVKAILKEHIDKSPENESKINALINKQDRQEKTLIINPIIKNIMLSNISEEFVNRFQIEYFSNVLGNSFREINSSTLGPLLHHESLMLHGMNKVLRYPSPDVYIFWNMMGNIQENISRTLLEPGSIFTFAFEVEELEGNWFVLELKENMDVKVRFLKTGIWVYHRRMAYEEVYYGQDIFNCDDDEELTHRPCKEQTLKLLYNTFETLGLSMFNESNFFDYDPQANSYDLFTFLLNSDKRDTKIHPVKPEPAKPKSKKKKDAQQDPVNPNKENEGEREETRETREVQETPLEIKITKVMGVILSRQNLRAPGEELKYKLTEIKKSPLEVQKNLKKKKAFRFDEDDAETLEKLDSLADEESQRVIDYESLEFAYLVETMESIRDICLMNLENLVKQAEIIFNKEFALAAPKGQ